MSLTSTSTQRPRLTFDGRTIQLQLLFAMVMLPAMWLAVVLEPTTSSVVTSSSRSTQAAAGVGWVLVEVVFAVALLGAIVLWRRAPSIFQAFVDRFERPLVWALVAIGFTQLGVPGVAILLLGAVSLANVTGHYWMFNNTVSVIVAIGLGAYAAVLLGPWFLGVGIVGLTVYDWWFADRRTHMFDLAKWSIRHKLPLLVVIPLRVRLPWHELVDGVADDDDDGAELLSLGIGMADLMLPAALIAALALEWGFVAIGAVGGVLLACARLSEKIERGGGAGLPAITAGMLGGAGVAALALFLGGLA